MRGAIEGNEKGLRRVSSQWTACGPRAGSNGQEWSGGSGSFSVPEPLKATGKRGNCQPFQDFGNTSIGQSARPLEKPALSVNKECISRVNSG